MPFTAEQRAKSLATRAANKAKKDAEQAKLVGKTDTLASPATEREERLLKEIAELKQKLGDAPAAVSNAFLQPGDPAVPTGKTIKVRVLKKMESDGFTDSGREKFKPVWESRDVPTFRLKINLPPVGGMDIKINGESFYHGMEYTFDIFQLATVNEMVYRCWQHEQSIRGSDENFYRKPTRPQISARGM